jgi:hypothetical protein
MRDITRPGLLYSKAALFVGLGLASAGFLVARSPSLWTAILLAICVWAFARAYYFAFYVIERYIDPSFRFAGLWSCVRYLLNRGSARRRGASAPRPPTGRIPRPC